MNVGTVISKGNSSLELQNPECFCDCFLISSEDSDDLVSFIAHKGNRPVLLGGYPRTVVLRSLDVSGLFQDVCEVEALLILNLRHVFVYDDICILGAKNGKVKNYWQPSVNSAAPK